MIIFVNMISIFITMVSSSTACDCSCHKPVWHPIWHGFRTHSTHCEAVWGSSQYSCPYVGDAWRPIASGRQTCNIVGAGGCCNRKCCNGSGPSLGTSSPTKNPTSFPTRTPTSHPTKNPTSSPTRNPTNTPTRTPTSDPTISPTNTPTRTPTSNPTKNPTNTPTRTPTSNPTKNPTKPPTLSPSPLPTAKAFMMKINGFHGSPESSLSQSVFAQERVGVKKIDFDVQSIKMPKDSTKED